MPKLTLRHKLLIRDTLLAVLIGILGTIAFWKILAVSVPEILLLLYSLSFGSWVLVVASNPVYPRIKKRPKREGFVDG